MDGEPARKRRKFDYGDNVFSTPRIHSIKGKSAANILDTRYSLNV